MRKPSAKEKRCIKSGVNLAPLGQPPEALTAQQKEAWQRIGSACYPGVLRQSDRLSVEFASRLCVKVESKKANKTERKLFKRMLSKFCIKSQSMSTFGL